MDSQTSTPQTGAKRSFDAFVSYRHAGSDEKWAKWLSSSLEGYRVPRRMVREQKIAARLERVFRDEDELSGSDLNSEIEDALEQSRFLIVVCSPRTPQSPWVAREVKRFRDLGRADKILALLIEGEPAASFPEPLRDLSREVIDAQGQAREQKIEPVAGDVRQPGGPIRGCRNRQEKLSLLLSRTWDVVSGARGQRKRNAKLRILASILGVRFDDLRQRDRSRRQWRRMLWSGAAVVALALFGIAAGLALSARRTQVLARNFNAEIEQGSWSANKMEAIDGIISRWMSLAPQDATAARSRANRALSDDIDARMHRPNLLAGDVAQIRGELALLKPVDGGEASRLDAALQARLRQLQTLFELKAPFREVPDNPWPGLFKTVPGDNSALKPSDRLEQQLLASTVPIGAHGKAMMTLSYPSWVNSGYLGLAFASRRQSSGTRPQDGNGYQFIVCIVPPAGSTEAMNPMEALARGGKVQLRISGPTRRLRTCLISFDQFGKKPLQLSVTRDGARIIFQANDLPPLEVEEAFPASEKEAGYLALMLQPVSRVQELSAASELEPPAPQPIERADSQFLRGDFKSAIAAYEASAICTHDPVLRQEARYKQAVCEMKCGDVTGAISGLEPLANEEGDRWPAAAGCQLWVLYEQQKRDSDASAVMTALHTRYKDERLIAVMPEETRDAFRAFYISIGSRFSVLRRPRPEEINRLLEMERLDIQSEFHDGQLWTDLILARAYEMTGNPEKAVCILEQSLEDPSYRDLDYMFRFADDYCCLMGMRHQAELAMNRLDKAFANSRGNARDWMPLARAKLLRDMNRPDEAEKVLVDFLDRSRKGGVARIFVARAGLMLGFLREQKGDPRVREAWEEAQKQLTDPQRTISERDAGADDGLYATAYRITVACLAGVPDEQIQSMMDAALAASDNPVAVRLVLTSLPKITGGFVKSVVCQPRGRALARRLAFMESPMPELCQDGARYAAECFLLSNVFSADASPDQQSICAQLAAGLLNAYSLDQVKPAQMGFLANAWNGNLGIFGWKGASLSLDAKLRGPLAYVLGMHCERESKPEAAADFFNYALGRSANDPTLARLAQAELNHNSNAKVPTSRPAE